MYEEKYDTNPYIRNGTSGFALEWFLKDISGARINKTSQQSFGQRNSNFKKMIDLAARARTENMTHDEIIEKAIEVKYKMGLKKTNVIDYDVCSTGQIKVESWRNPFEKITLGLPTVPYQGNISTDDLVTGFKIYSILVFCNQETLKLGQFLYNIVSDTNLRTIIKSAVGTIELGRVKEWENKNLLFDFYRHLEETFNLQLGKILLAVSSPFELREMLIKKLPYITKFSNEIDSCLNNGGCEQLKNLVGAQGGLVLIR